MGMFLAGKSEDGAFYLTQAMVPRGAATNERISSESRRFRFELQLPRVVAHNADIGF